MSLALKLIPLVFVGLMLLASTPGAQAQLEPIADCSNLNIPCTGGENESAIVEAIQRLILAVSGVMSFLAVLFFVYAGFKYITSRGDEQEAAQAKQQMLYGAIGLAISGGAAAAAYAIGNAVVLTVTGTPEPASGLIINLIDPFINLLVYVVGTVAVIYFIYGGYKYITSGGQEDEAAQAKRQMLYGVIGIVVVVAARAIADVLLLPSAGSAELLVNTFIVPVLNAFLTLAGVAAVAYVILAGVMYFSSSGDEQRAATAKQQIIYALVGIVIIILAAVIVRFVDFAISP